MATDYHINPASGVWDDTYYATVGRFLDPNAVNHDQTPAPFSFDYEGEAQKAYGELGAYYGRLLKESQGDMNKVLSRLVEDYDRGKRMRREDYEVAREQAETGVKSQALQRGIYQKSAYDTSGGMGLADALLRKATTPIERSYERAGQAADISKVRTEEDVREAQKRREFDLEQRRRTEAGELANIRGSRALQKWQATNMI